MSSEPGDITLLLQRIRNGDRPAESQLMTAIYPQLMGIASRLLRSEPKGHSLEPTILVNDLYLKAIRQSAVDWQGREHLFRVAVRVMRNVLVDHAREKGAAKRPPSSERLPLEEVANLGGDDRLEEILWMQELMNQLGGEDQQLAEIVELRYFGGYTVDEIAHLLVACTN